MKIFRKITLILSSIILALVGYMVIYQIVYHLPGKPSNATELDYSNNTSEFYLSEIDYATQMVGVNSYTNNFKNKGTLEASDGLKLSYETYIQQGAKASIVIAHGFTESKIKYQEVIYYYLKSNYNVFIMDHRGHGESGREVKDRSLVYIKDFNDYVEDLALFINTVVKPNSLNLKVVLYAHSMGGGISTYLCEQYPGIVDLLVLSAPMIHAMLGVTESLAKPIIDFNVAIGNGKNYVIGNGPYEKTEFKIDESCTSSEARGFYAHSLRDLEYNQLWGASYSWAQQTIKATHQIQKVSNIKKISCPVLLFQAGKDTYVYPDGQNKVSKYCKNIKLITVSKSKHEIWAERNEIMVPYFNTIFNYLDGNI